MTVQRLEEALGRVFTGIGDCLAGVGPAPGAEPGASARESAKGVTRVYAAATPAVRLISGLAEGADDMAARVASSVADTSSPVRWETAGVLAFPKDAYRSSRAPGFQTRFDALYRSCAYVVELDGRYDPAQAAWRHRAYRAQTTVLLRHADLLIAVADVSAPGRAGGTLETVRAALAFRLPVVFIDAASAGVRVILPDDVVGDLEDGLLPASDARVQDELSRWVRSQVAGPDVETDPDALEGSVSSREHGERILKEFFDPAASPRHCAGGRTRRTVRSWLWTAFESRFKAGVVPGDLKIDAYRLYRDRASALTNRYAGLYRGAFLLNYVLGVLAVAIAAVSFVVLAGGHTVLAGLALRALTSAPAEIASLAAAAGTDDAPILFGLGLLELGIVIAILLNTHHANRGRWNQCAVDYRYLAERLRAMYYLPRAGSFQPPAPAAPGHSARAVRQSAVDWLFAAVVRHVSPAELGQRDAAGVAVLRPSPEDAVRAIGHWLSAQHSYHASNASTMHAMFLYLEHRGQRLNQLVIAAIAADLLLLGGAALHAVPHWLHDLTPWLVFLAAVLPAAIAAFNGVRFQAECRHLAQRSDVMRRTLQGHQERLQRLSPVVSGALSSPAANPGSWAAHVLGVAEVVARDMANEAADWSALYENVIPEA